MPRRYAEKDSAAVASSVPSLSSSRGLGGSGSLSGGNLGGHAGGGLLGLLLAAARALAHAAAVEQHLEAEGLVVVGAALAELTVGERLIRRALHEFLQKGLVVAALLLGDLLALGVEQHAVDERARRADAAVKVHGGKDRLGRVGQNGRARAPAAALLAVAEL